ncbi:MAG: helix-turn-helix transcriptional regulator [Lachnospiraceae bacterium]|nr:helix-turn-helix transcriptional regulator [Lachnospiraceae bacterium]
MSSFNFADNIVRLRREKGITQEQLAEFIGVTKAAVSKWENRQSLPDILILPELAAFFDISIDTLLGYEPQLSKEQIQKLYQELAAEFAEQPFEEVMERSRELARKYYSCYPFLFQIGCLWLNHFMLEPDPEGQKKILSDLSKLCDRVAEECKEIRLCNDVVMLKAMTDLQLGKAKEVVENIAEMLDPCRLTTNGEGILIQAYQMSSQQEKAKSYTQVSMLLHLLGIVGGAGSYLAICQQDRASCETTIERMEVLFEIYQLENLHPNAVMQFYYQAALYYCSYGEVQKALDQLERYGACGKKLLAGELLLQGDDYFDSVEDWFDQLDLGRNAPRHRKIVLESFLQTLEYPAFEILKDEPEYHRILRSCADLNHS